SWRRYIEPCPPLVRIFDYRFSGKNYHDRTPSYDSTHRTRSLYRRLCRPVAEKILPHRSKCIPTGAYRHHSLRHLNRQLHGQSLVCACPHGRGGDGDVQSCADVVGAADRSERTIYGSECPDPEHDQPGYHFWSGSEWDRDCPVRFTGSAVSERGHVSCSCPLPRVSATGPSGAIRWAQKDRWFIMARPYGGAGLCRDQTTCHLAADRDCGMLRIRCQRPDDVVSCLRE